MTVDLHTHTYRCGHAEGDVSDYAKVAVEKGLTVLGISEHAPIPPGIKLNPDTNMQMADVDNYETAIDQARIRFPELKILKGLECSYFPGSDSFYEYEFLNLRRFDYLIGSVHNIKKWRGWDFAKGGISKIRHLKQYTKNYIRAMESGIFTFMAHPDRFMLSPLVWDKNTEAASREICIAAEKLNIPLEINGGLIIFSQLLELESWQKYTALGYPFWKIAAEYNVKTVINSDAHTPEDVALGGRQGKVIIDNCSLKQADININGAIL